MMKFQLHIGHIGLLDAAPLLIAQERGYFAGEGLAVTLSCELGLATLCGKLADNRLDGACVPAPLLVLLSLGGGVARVPMQAVLMCSYQGMGIVMATPRSSAPDNTAPIRMGVIAPGAPTRLLLQRLSQVAPQRCPVDAVQVPVAASQLIDFMREGMLDGFCGIDPLPALARSLGGAEIIADSATLSALHPGSVVALRSEAAGNNPQVAAALGRALLRAREHCAVPAHREEVYRLVIRQYPYSELDAAARSALVQALIEGGQPAAMSMRFDGPAEGVGLAVGTEAFLDAACRGAVGSGVRGLDFKAKIARLFASRTVPGRVQILNKVS